MCRGLRRYYVGINDPDGPLGGVTEPCNKQGKQVGPEEPAAGAGGPTQLPVSCFAQVNRDGCATFVVLMSFFTRVDNKVVDDRLRITADVAEEGTGEAWGGGGGGRKGRSGG